MDCPYCGKDFKTKTEMEKHLASEHPDNLKVDKRTAKEMAYRSFIRKDRRDKVGVCSCGKPKPWMEDLGRYAYYCYSDEHKAYKAQQAKDNNIKAGKPAHGFQDEKTLYKAITAESKSLLYTASNGKEFYVLSSVETGILKVIDDNNYDMDRVISPGPMITYTGLDKKIKKHIPDILMDEYGCIISGKDSLSNPNMHKNVKEARVNNVLEYIHILNKTDYHFIQVEGKEDLTHLPEMLDNMTTFNAKGARYVVPPRIDIYFAESEDENEALAYEMIESQIAIKFYVVTFDSDGNIVHRGLTYNESVRNVFSVEPEGFVVRNLNDEIKDKNLCAEFISIPNFYLDSDEVTLNNIQYLSDYLRSKDIDTSLIEKGVGYCEVRRY